MKTSTLTAIIATAFTLAAFDSAQADDTISQTQEGGAVTADASSCGGANECGGTPPQKVSATPDAAGASQRIDTNAQ